MFFLNGEEKTLIDSNDDIKTYNRISVPFNANSSDYVFINKYLFNINGDVNLSFHNYAKFNHAEDLVIDHMRILSLIFNKRKSFLVGNFYAKCNNLHELKNFFLNEINGNLFLYKYLLSTILEENNYLNGKKIYDRLISTDSVKFLLSNFK